MAVTGAIFKSLIFDDIDSRNYGVYITGEAVYNAPEREVEMITIAGRNGQLALDKGRFENIEVTYPAGIFADNQADYAKAISDFRNALCSKVGYQRLTDEYNVDEYRMAVYKSGLEVSSVNSAGEFQITFDCQPQRFLMSGEAPITVSSGDTILNPTHFESKPMLEAEGYGTIEFNGFEIELTNEVLGNVEVLPRGSVYQSALKTFSKAQFNAGDTITILDPRIQSGNAIETEYYVKSLDASRFRITFTNSNENFSTGYSEPGGESRTSFTCGTRCPAISFTAGTAETVTNRTTFVCKDSTSPATVLGELYVDITISYNPSYSDDLSSILFDISFEISDEEYAYGQPSYIKWGNVTVDSTLSLLGHPTYIDCDLGEAYLIRDNTPISLNRYIDLGSELPTFAVGSNEITYDNTITDLKVIPRWWIV